MKVSQSVVVAMLSWISSKGYQFDPNPSERRLSDIKMELSLYLNHLLNCPVCMRLKALIFYCFCNADIKGERGGGLVYVF